MKTDAEAALTYVGTAAAAAAAARPTPNRTSFLAHLLRFLNNASTLTPLHGFFDVFCCRKAATTNVGSW